MWGLEGAAIVWVGLRQRRRLATAFGLALQLLAGGAFYVGYAMQAPGFPWIAAIVIALRRHETQAVLAFRQMLHVGATLLLAAVGAIELHWLAARYAAPHTAWTIASFAVAPCIVLMALASRRAERTWPVRDNL